MLRKSALLAGALVCAAALQPGFAQAGTDSLPVGRCINMGNHLEAPTEGEWGGKLIDAADFQRIADAGFSTIRLPVRWSTRADSAPPYPIAPAFMQRVKAVVADARGAGLNVILDSHHFEQLHADPSPANIARLAGMWTQIAAAFADQPDAHLWFEIENEPHDKFDDSNLLDVLTPALAEIRKSNPTRPVIIGGESWSGINSLTTLQLPDDPHIVPTFHYYDPFDFTHQGATWVDPSPPIGRAYGNAADRQRLVDDVAKVRDYIARTGKTPFMGETGANGPIPLSERVKYQTAVRIAFDAAGIAMCSWGYTNTFPLWDQQTGAWLPGMLGAVGLAEPDGAARADIAPPIDIHPRLVGKGDVITDYSTQDWPRYGLRETLRMVAAREVPGGQAVQFTIAAAGTNPYDAGLSIPVRRSVTEGTPFTVAVLARTISADTPDGKGRIGLRIQQVRPPYPGFGDTTIAIGPNWGLYQLRTTARMTLVAGEGVVGLHLAGAKQVIEIGQVYLLDTTALPQPSTTPPN